MKRSLALSFALLFSLTYLRGEMKHARHLNLGGPTMFLNYSAGDLLQVPKGTWPGWQPGGALRGKVAVVEFLSIKSGDCLREIPFLNGLADSLDPAKVQFVAVDEDSSGLIKKYLENHPINAWIISDRGAFNAREWGVGPLPTIFVIDTKGSVALMIVHPEHLRREALLQLANGEKVALENETDAKADAETGKLISDAQQAQARYDSRADPQFSISITPTDPATWNAPMPWTPGPLPGGGRHKYIMMRNATSEQILLALGIKPGRLKTNGFLPEGRYDFEILAPSLDDPKLKAVVDQAIELNCGVKLERHTSLEKVYVLKGTKKSRLLPYLPGNWQSVDSSYTVGSNYVTGLAQLELTDATADDIADGLEGVLDRPVLNETGLSGDVSATVPVAPNDFRSVRDALEKNTGLTLEPAKRPVETITLTANPTPASDSAELSR